MDNPIRAHAIITGRVQGVWFRMETCKVVEKFQVSGWVRNRRDGSVEAVFEGDEADVKAVLVWCGKGPSLSKVDQVEVVWEPYSGEFRMFEVVYSRP